LAWIFWVGGVSVAGPDESVIDPNQLGNVFFTAAPSNPLQRPHVVTLPLPDVPGAEAIWGATGRDHEGHIWCGLSMTSDTGYGTGAPSAHLLEYIPESNRFVDHGDVLSHLKDNSAYEQGERQNRIQSRIVEGPDECLYFASMDIAANYDDGPWFSDWSSHLWRVSPDRSTWKLLATVPEGVTAVAVAGPWVYALGYPCHRLYQYHIPTGKMRSVRVGSVIGHASWNMLVDQFGHAYVPRVQYPATTPSDVRVDLVEFDTNLHEVAATPLPDYCGASAQDELGIAGVQPLPGGVLAFVTHTGALYAVSPSGNGPAEVRSLGRFPLRPGESYASGLFAWGGDGYLLGIGAMHPPDRPAVHDWLVFNTHTHLSLALPMDRIGTAESLEGARLYGSMTRDAQGRFYVGGRSREGQPLLLQLDFSSAVSGRSARDKK
jgi:hypothetical protein